MNAQRRKAIRQLIEQLETLIPQVEEVRDDEQDAFDNMPESIQDSERGETMDGYIENLDCAATLIQEAIDELQNIVEQ